LLKTRPDLSRSEENPVAGTSAHRSERPMSILSGEFLDQLRKYQEGLIIVIS
jgi:hypothetical protein